MRFWVTNPLCAWILICRPVNNGTELPVLQSTVYLALSGAWISFLRNLTELDSEGYLHLLKTWPAFFIIFSLRKGHAHIVHRGLTIRVNCLVVKSSNSTAESGPVFIWVMFILARFRNRNVKCYLSTNHHTLCLFYADLDFQKVLKNAPCTSNVYELDHFKLKVFYREVFMKIPQFVGTHSFGRSGRGDFFHANS